MLSVPSSICCIATQHILLDDTKPERSLILLGKLRKPHVLGVELDKKYPALGTKHFNVQLPGQSSW